jgi:hypothetical protein
MDEHNKMTVRRRGFLGIVAASGLTAAAATVPFGTSAVAEIETYDEKRKPRYRESQEVKTFYRVNRYPKSAKR